MAMKMAKGGMKVIMAKISVKVSALAKIYQLMAVMASLRCENENIEAKMKIIGENNRKIIMSKRNESVSAKAARKRKKIKRNINNGEEN
jgi:hypothetical protein